MPYLTRASPDRELERLIRLYLKAETDIINEINRLRSQGLTDYHAAAALERVQNILRSLENDCWTYVPKMVEAQFYVRHPDARAVSGETVEKHLTAYRNAQALTSTQTDIVQRLTMNLMGQLTEASATVLSGLQSGLIGRVEPDVYRRVGLAQVALQQAAGRGVNQSVPQFIDALRREGVTAFTDKAGRNWSLHTYCTMVSRSTSRQAEILSVLTADPEHDLYRISTHGTTCGLCAPYEGRVYSKSGKDPDFPPLSAAFGKIDPDGADDLSNSWLNIHPNCLHALLRWSPAGRTPEEIEEIKRFSNPKTNPFTRDPRSEAQIAAYRKKEQARARWLRDRRQWENYRSALGSEVPRTFETFQRHKSAGDEKYRKWQLLYRNRDRSGLPASAQGIQEYRKDRGEASSMILTRRAESVEISVRRVESYQTPVYVSDKASIKPKALHEINRNTEKALSEWGVDSNRKPSIVIVSDNELQGAVGIYDPCENIVYYAESIGKKAVQDASGGLGAVEAHEMWHMKQAEDFRKMGWTISRENRGLYLDALCKKCKKRIDKLGITRDNVGEISDYAARMYHNRRFDEVEAEYQSLKKRRW